MSLSNQIVGDIYSGDGIVVDFAIPFTALYDTSSETRVVLRDETDLENIVETLQVEGVDYSLTGNPLDNVRFVTAPTSDEKVLVKRVLDYTQLAEFLQTSVFPVDTNELQLDNSVALSQQIQEIVDRCPKLPETHEQNVPFEIPEPTEEVIWGYDENGDFVYFTPQDLLELINEFIYNELLNIRATQGTVTDDVDMGTFTGDIISDNNSVKGALQELETTLDGIKDALDYQGTWDADTNTPDIANAAGLVKGWFWIVSVAGSTNVGGITDWGVNDWAVYNGTGWDKIDNTDLVVSVNTKTGAVVIDPDDLDDTSTTNKFNVTHTGEVTGATALAVDKTAITNQTPLVPDSGDFFLFSDTSDGGNLKKADFDDLGGGSGGVPEIINYIPNPDAEQGATGWAVYDDGSNPPIDGTGGSPSFVSIGTTNTDPVRGLQSFLFDKTAGGSASQEGVSADFTIRDADKGKLHYVSFEFRQNNATNLSFGSMSVYVYDITNATMKRINTNGLANLANDTDVASFSGSYLTASNSNDYRLLIHITDSQSAAYALVFDNVHFGPSRALTARPKTQNNFLITDRKTNGAMLTLQFDNLILGQWYELNFQAVLGANIGGADAFVYVEVQHNSAVLIRPYFQVTSAGSSVGGYSSTIKFQAEATSLIFEAFSASALSYIFGDGTKSETYAQLTEIDPLETGSEW